MAEGKTQTTGSIFDPPDYRVISRQGVGLEFPKRDPAHEDPEWYQRDLDEPESDDPDMIDPLPTERHRTVPGF